MIGSVAAHAGQTIEIKGRAYDFGHAIRAVQFSLDGGAHWTTYDTPNTNDYQCLRWSFSYTPQRIGNYIMHVRSVNDEGTPSPEAAFVQIVVD